MSTQLQRVTSVRRHAQANAPAASYWLRRVVDAQTGRARSPGAESADTSLQGKGSPYSIAERRVPELIPVLGSQPAGDVSHKPGGSCHYFPPGPRLPSQHSRGPLPISLLGEQRHNGCEHQGLS